MKKRILCYGDSNTWGQVPGIGTRYPEESRWPMVAQKALGDDYVLIEEAISGRTTAYDRGHDDYLNGKTALGYAIKAHRPLDGVILSLGINDLVEHSLLSSMRGLEELIRLLQNADAVFRCTVPVFPNGTKILVLGTPPLHPSIQNASPFDTPFHGKYEDSLLLAEGDRRIAKKKGVAFLDATPYVEATELDYVHFTPESHVRLGLAVSEKLKELFEA
ncbi:MAG: hypothetical protein KBS81_09925 [Spirochaetales bacterium]|nr:hypothetical protein [Candidatus Physcosoma equi]